MSSYTYAQYTYPPEEYTGYPVEQPHDYDNSTSPSSFGGGGHAMTVSNSSGSMSSTAESPTAWEWYAQPQQQYSDYNTMSSTPQAYFSLPEDPAYTPPQYYQPVQQAQPAQESSRRQRSTTESAPRYVLLFPRLPFHLSSSSSSSSCSSPTSLHAIHIPHTNSSPPHRSPPPLTGPRLHSALICLHPGCESSGRFKRKADLHRHMNTMHEVTQRFSCPRPRCDRKHDRGFSRKDHLYEHLRNTHGVDVPKAGGERKRRKADPVAA